MNLAEAMQDQALRVRLCSYRLELYLLYYLRESFPVPFSDDHKRLIKLLQEGKFEEALIIAHRNFGKTLIVKGYILWLLCYDRVKFIIIAAQEQTKSAGHAFDIGLQLQINTRILGDFGSLYWEDTADKKDLKKKLRKKSDWFLTTKGAMVKATQSSIRGEVFTDDNGTYRPDLVYYDDIENLKTVASYALTEKIIANLGESKNAKAIGGKSIFAVNRLSSLGVVSFLEARVDNINNVMFESKLIDSNLVLAKENIIESAKKNIQWKHRYVATDMQKKLFNKYTPDVKNSVESIESLLRDGMSVFMREYQNEPQESTETFVSKKDIKDNYYTIAKRDWKYVIAADPQSGLTLASDEYAITVIGYEWQDPHRYVVEQIAGRGSPTEQAKQFILLMLKYYDNLEISGVEVIGTQTAVYLTILDWIKGMITIEGVPVCDKEFRFVKVGSKDNKETRLNRFIPAFERGEIHLKPNMLELEGQLIYFTNLPHDDRADSVILGLELVNRTKGNVYSAKKTGYNENDKNSRYGNKNYEDKDASIVGNIYNKQY